MQTCHLLVQRCVVPIRYSLLRVHRLKQQHQGLHTGTEVHKMQNFEQGVHLLFHFLIQSQQKDKLCLPRKEER